MGISDRLKKKELDKLFQAKVSRLLYDSLRNKLAKNRVTRRAFLEASIKEYLKEG